MKTDSTAPLGRSLWGIVTCIELLLGSTACLAGERVSIASQSPNPLYPNQPAGFVTLVDQAWDAIPPYPGTAAGGWWEGEFVVNATIVNDATAPQSPPNVLACHVPAGVAGGVATCVVNDADFKRGGGGYFPKLYVSVWVKHSANWVPHPVGSKMLWFVHPDGLGPGYTDVYSTFEGSSMSVGVRQQNYGNQGLLANVGPALYRDAVNFRGHWQQYEFLLTMNTGTSANGSFRMWVDRHLVCDYPNVRWMTTDSGQLWTGIRYDNVYGGIGGSSASQYEYIDHIYASGGN